MEQFSLIDSGIDVRPVLGQLAAHPELWDRHTPRKAGPHVEVSDIWVRHRDLTPFLASGDYRTFNDEHFPVWYPAWRALPALREIVFGLMAKVQATILGGILITRIPPGGQVYPHRDFGWHANFYNCKIYVPLKSNDRCLNICEDEREIMRSGEAWSFDNLKTHSVENHGAEERITLIVCMKCDAGPDPIQGGR